MFCLMAYKFRLQHGLPLPNFLSFRKQCIFSNIFVQLADIVAQDKTFRWFGCLFFSMTDNTFYEILINYFILIQETSRQC